MARKQGKGGFRPKMISLAVASCFVTTAVFANPTGPAVVSGTAAIQGLGTNLVQITNSPSAIINWQSFSIGASEITRFIQQSQASAVLNRVTGNAGVIDPSVILGALQSNGRVFLINPSGIVFGAGAQVDVAGLVASSLNLSDADFLANRLKFSEVAGAGSVVNQGNITTSSGGQVYLVGPAVTNSGIITSPQGEVVLAAGNSVELVSPGTPNLRVEITAPDNQAVNLGKIVSESGRVGIYAGLINNAGTIRADSAVAEGGRILLKATKSVTLESSSILDASGVGGGTIEVLSKNGGTVNVAGRLDASAPVSGDGGFIDTSADKVTIADGTVVTTVAPNGKSGMWLIDPNDYTIASYGGDITGLLLSTNLGSTSITITSDQGFNAYGSGAINVDDAVSWNSANSLTLIARGSVNVNQSITNGGTGGISMYAGWDGVSTSTPNVPLTNFGSIYLNAPISTLGDVILVAPSGINQASTVAPIAANRLLADGGEGGVFLDMSTNMVNTLAGRAALDISPGCCGFGGFHFVNGQSLAVGSVGGVNGITTHNGEVSVSATGGTLTVDQPISAAMRPGSYGGAVYLSGDNGVTINSAVSVVGGNNSNVFTFAGDVGGNSAYASVYSSSGSIVINGGGSVTVTGGNAGTVSDGAYGGNVFAIGGYAQVWLDAANGIVVNGNVSATGGNGGSATTTNGYSWAWGGSADVNLYGGTGGISGSGTIGATAGLGGTANGGGAFFSDATGGQASVSMDSIGQITMGGAISAIGRAGGSASGDSAYAAGGSSYVDIYSDTGVTLNGAASATGGAGGTASATTFHTADGGSSFVHVGTPGPVTIGGGITAMGGNGGPGGSPRAGGYADIVIDGGEGGGTAGAIQISGALAATGGNGAGVSSGGGALVVAAGSSVNVGAAITATGGNGTPVGVAEVDIFSLGDVTLGGNITTSGGVFVDQQTFDYYGGIIIEAGLGGAGAIISNGGILSAVHADPLGDFPVIELSAVNGIGTIAAPVRILDGSDLSGPDISMKNTGTTGDIAVSITASDVSLIGDGLANSFNNNPNGIYLIQTEAAGKNLLLDVALLPGGAPLLSGQTVLLGALNADVIIGPSGSIATSGTGFTSLLAGGSITSNGNITGPVYASAQGGTITLNQPGSVTLGSLQATGHVSVNSSGGAIIDGNTSGLNIIAPSAGLFGAFGVGSLADPIETQVGVLSGSATGTFGVINTGNLAINGFTFSGTDAAIGTTGTLSLMTPISATTGNLALVANNGMLIEQGVIVGGDLILSAGAGDLGIAGADVTATNIAMTGNNIFVGFQSSTAPTNVVASNLVTGVSAGNFNVLGGSTSGANALLEGQDVSLVVGTTSGYLNIASGSSGATAQISSVSPTTITVNFPNLSSGGYFVDGVEGAITNGNTGFFAGGSPAILDQNLIVTYGLTPPPPPPPGGTEPPPAVDNAVNQVVDSTNQLTEEEEKKLQQATSGGTGGTEGEQDKKELPVCR